MAIQSDPDYLEDHRYRLLLGAVAEYLDDDKVDELLDHLKRICEEEKQKFLRHAESYSKFQNFLLDLNL